ncbi:MAG: hypothetical protein L3J79_04340, partial [Candidatus Marinimicrobia bacterium]|nr:hypothetical protein [Candidatus Neomarinimicrobiota bacterium]
NRAEITNSMASYFDLLPLKNINTLRKISTNLPLIERWKKLENWLVKIFGESHSEILKDRQT